MQRGGTHLRSVPGSAVFMRVTMLRSASYSASFLGGRRMHSRL
jgi:hypothetical protein